MLQLNGYDGGKGNLYQKIINLIPPHQVYIEPFLGGGAVMRHKRPAMLNIGLDLDQRVIDGWSIVKGGDTAVSSQTAIPATIASNDGGAVPPLLTMLANHSAATIKSDGVSWQFICGDALKFLEVYPFTGGEFVYADPPYLLSTRSSQRPLYLHELNTEQEHEQLLTLLKGLPCHVMLSGYWSELYSYHLSGWHTAVFTAYDRANKPREEWLWMNYPTPIALHDYKHLGDGFRERERIKKKKNRWVKKLQMMRPLERQALLSAIEEAF